MCEDIKHFSFLCDAAPGDISQRKSLKKERSVGDAQAKAISPSIRRKARPSSGKKLPTWSTSKVKK